MKLSSVINTFILLQMLYILPSSAQSIEETNIFDAITSASKALKVTGGTIYKTHAVIRWVEWYKDEPHVDAYQLEWGTEPGVFTNIINLKPFSQKTVTATSITPLTENTTYYARFYRVFEEVPEITDFYFNTPPLPSPIKISAPIRRLHKNTEPHFYSIYSLDGKSVTPKSAYSPDNHSFSILNPISSGIYLIRYYSGDENASTAHSVITR